MCRCRSHPRPCVVGVDDWALRKGWTYGSIVVDLERRRPPDLLPDRSAETWAAWLRHEPQIRLVARDCSTEYARGTTLGAPATVQVADRWHLLLNTRQMAERWLARVPPRLKLLPPTTAPALSTQRIRAYPRSPAETLARAAAVGRWEELYDDVRRRRADGQSLRQINRETGLARATVRKYAFAERFPRHGRRGPGCSIVDPHLDHLHARQAAGCENAMQLWHELRSRGFAGTVKQIRRWLSERRTRPARTTIRRLQTPLPSPKQLSWQLLREPNDLDAEAAAAVARVLQDDEAAKVADLGRRLCRIVRSRCGSAPAEPGIAPAFDTWLSDARACGVRVVESFASSLAQDGAAVQHGTVEDDTLERLYADAHFLAIPSYHEGFCKPVVEALRAGCIPVGYASYNLPHVAIDFGRLAPPGDVAGLKSALRDLIRTLPGALQSPTPATFASTGAKSA